MSADNYYLIRKHPAGGYAAVMGFESDEIEPKVRAARHRSFATVREAIDFANSEYTEYGSRLHMEVVADIMPEEGE